MKETIRSPRMAVAVCVMFVALLALPWAAELVTTKPEEVGLSTERLARINAMMQKRIAAGEISGGVTLVARKGRIAHLEAHGMMDTESRKPMSRDAVFRIASMTKPVAGVAIMMMLEEGKLRLTDPISKYIPQFKDMKVAVAQPAEGPGTNGQTAAPAGGPPPAPRF
jgi:CubicO group peptidase (beta-lactamase class C family)